MTDRQRGVLVCSMRQRLVDEQVARRATDHLKHLVVAQAVVVQALDQPLAGTLRGHADPAALQIVLYHSRFSRMLRPRKAS
ncbi:hypothetical protein D9M72_637590 [compost metagenome]